MAKKSLASYRPEKLRSVKAEDIINKPLSRREKAIIRQLAAKPDSKVDFCDIPELTDKQLANLRPGPKVLVTARIDRDVYNWLQRFGEGYSTRINRILRAVMEKSR
jgi:uncharacterized protein (DUF4415 family)